MKTVLAALVGACFLTFVTSASAEIRVELPRSATAEELVEIFDAEAGYVGGIDVKIQTGSHYEPGSVKEVPDHYLVRINRLATFLFWEVPKSPTLMVKLHAGGEYLEIVFYDSCHVMVPSYCKHDSASTADWDFKKMQAQFEKLLGRVYTRLSAK